jgi:hypothetical protein
MYTVGFGDAFLVSFRYDEPVPDPADAGDPRPVRHVLIDCGSTSGPRTGWRMTSVVEAIARDCDHRLDALVVSHRHRDHLSALAGANGDLLAGLRPGLVVRSWTEDPRLERDDTAPPDARHAAGPARGHDAPDPAEQPFGAADLAHLGALRRAEQRATTVMERAEAAGVTRATDLVELAGDQVPNGPAIRRLDELAEHGRGEYLWAGRSSRLADVVPGVQFRVLGPPLPSQWPAVVRQADESDEFWLATGVLEDRLFAAPVERDADVPLGTARWIMDRMRATEPDRVAGIVRWLDEAINNTSIILLITVRGRRMLFGGDAQLEGWGWCLDQLTRDRTLADDLANVELYKVGHHGSRNATPRSLVRLWVDRPPTPLLSLLSTKGGVHGRGEHRVPREPLVTTLRALGRVVSTDDDATLDWHDVSVRLPDGAFEVTHSP